MTVLEMPQLQELSQVNEESHMPFGLVTIRALRMGIDGAKFRETRLAGEQL